MSLVVPTSDIFFNAGPCDGDYIVRLPCHDQQYSDAIGGSGNSHP